MSVKYILLESMSILDSAPNYQLIIVAFVAFLSIWMLSKSRKPRSIEISDEELHERLANWHPECLVDEVDPNHPFLRPKLVTTRVGKRLTVDGKDCLNMGTHNYLGLLEDKRLEEAAISATRKYGIGSCGPRGFYGTVDVHLDLEERLAKFMDAEEAIVYSYGFSTVSSAISAYCKRRDIVFADERVNFAIQKGLDASRSTAKYFKHNDVEDFERLLVEQAKLDAKNPKKAERIRRFLIVEGIYMNTGRICPLPELVTLCRKYKLRLFIDESISFGSIGESGKGVTEFFGVPGHEVDLIMESNGDTGNSIDIFFMQRKKAYKKGSLEWAVGSIGGFCVGSSFIIEHQRLSGLGYCFSASLPPLLASAAIAAIDIMEKESSTLFLKLKNNCVNLHNYLDELKHFELSGLPESPVKHLFLKKKQDRSVEQQLLTEISEKCIDNNLAVITAPYLEAERDLPRPSLRLCVSSILEDEDLRFAAETIDKFSSHVL